MRMDKLTSRFQQCQQYVGGFEELVIAPHGQ